MKRILTFLFLTAACATFFASCAEYTEPDLTEFHNAAFDRWMEKYHPGIERLESGLYIEWIEQNPAGRRPTQGNFVSVDYTGRDQNGDYFLTRDSKIARQLGFFKLWTHYVPEFTVYDPTAGLSGGGSDYYYYGGYGYDYGYGYGGYGDYGYGGYGDYGYGYGGYGGYGDYGYGYGGYGDYGYGYPVDYGTTASTTAGYPLGVWQALGLMNEGDSVRLYIPPAMGYLTDFSNTDQTNGYSPYGAAVSSTQGVLFDLRLREVVVDPLLRERALVERYAADSLGIASPADSIALGVYMELLEANPAGEPIGADSLVTVYYTRRFLDGFVFDTNIEAKARANGTYDASATMSDGTSKWVGWEFYPRFATEFTEASAQPGFLHALHNLRNGEKARVVMVSGQAYGAAGSSEDEDYTAPVPSYTPIVIDIEVKSVGSSGAN
jgi:FKBP-type peptidyl-prolyl cis-trans isomerase